MRVTLAGFLSDHLGRVLLQRATERSLEPVACPLEPGQEPAKTLADAFRAATGLFVLPVRLVGVYDAGGDALTLSYRCALRGGELAPPDGQPPAGFFETQPPPRGLSGAHARQLDDALHHAGGPAMTARLAGPRWWRRARPAAEGDAVEWTIGVRLLLADAHGRVAWTKFGGDALWRLPLSAARAGQAPWEAAVSYQSALSLGHSPLALRRIVLSAAGPSVAFVFGGSYDGPPVDERTSGLHWAAPDAGAAELHAGDVALAAAAAATAETTAGLWE